MTVPPPTRILLLGGGFAGLAVARALEQALPPDGSVEATLISRDNYLLFTPMLAEVATGQLQPRHIAVPLRAFLRRVRVWQGEATGVDLQRRVVAIRDVVSGRQSAVPYDQLVLALGAVASFHHVPGAATYSLPFKRLSDAVRIHDRVIDCFEQAAVEPDPDRRRMLLTFVVAGGGLAGVELAAALADFLRETRRFFPSLRGEPLRLVLAHHGPRLLEELSEAAAAYTLRLLRQEGIAVRLATAVTRVAEDGVELAPAENTSASVRIPTHTVLWTAGVAPHPLIAALPVPRDQHGAVVVDEHLAVKDQPGLWALGDCAHIPAPQGGAYAPLAQNAEREGPVVAHNVLATLRGAPLRAFDYQPVGTLASLGSCTAVGEVFGLHFSGLPAWLLWRTVYLAKLPGLNRKVRVGLDWALDLAFPPDVVATHYYAAGPSPPPRA
ncbi:MAG TPA: NAD(P)/FAD-dependent oxidoreductase [Chloroflexota bacterium]|nr:NAD(P)/FAD-dependent oxidoreductase [Chloroflexota bacterium]